mmetsp:Transcript_59859/g.106438  ORF Transcript_59859/g.106438 Transcript_59859/m.106438 type:complete len:202 (-) Transcript_59859:111-716(-)|eukprot:CAMPEP_0197663354 /NCGR_PEP_ID=MMETSP1338-20131121/57115_1 /TAXON_ID=43686 ORGANISM="Pelagodinium beii, Strain RCC1491" /NCGR_SAMPLE_ID=MMETSP1338 /ASSEMBLY_ACC=CAM_ASM_000754 /LENGTH=201 /DNA_ID=CAMNT_0043241675 /DNA_START=62 /DNA_END=667 /DNA_ORIENTATION=-
MASLSAYDNESLSRQLTPVTQWGYDGCQLSLPRQSTPTPSWTRQSTPMPSWATDAGAEMPMKLPTITSSCDLCELCELNQDFDSDEFWEWHTGEDIAEPSPVPCPGLQGTPGGDSRVENAGKTFHQIFQMSETLAVSSDEFWTWHTGKTLADIDPNDSDVQACEVFNSDEFWTWHTGETVAGTLEISSDEFWEWKPKKDRA